VAGVIFFSLTMTNCFNSSEFFIKRLTVALVTGYCLALGGITNTRLFVLLGVAYGLPLFIILWESEPAVAKDIIYTRDPGTSDVVSNTRLGSRQALVLLHRFISSFGFF